MDNATSFLAPVVQTEQRWIGRVLRNETVGGVLLLVAALTAIVLANSPLHDIYVKFVEFSFGPDSLGLHLPARLWAADGLLAVFFFVAGVELRHEMSSGSLSTPRLAIPPIAAALGGMATSAIIFLVFNHGLFSAEAWGLPISTDIAFALAVLAVVGRGLPLELRAFLLTLAVVNDLGAISIIAIFYSHGFHGSYFGLSILLLAAFGLLQARGVRSIYIFAPLALAIWVSMFHSGIHATVAGIAMGMLMRVEKREGEEISPGDRMELVLRPISAGVCAPLFALTAAGVSLAGMSLAHALQQPLTLGVIFGLIIGQPLGVTVGAYIAVRFTRATLNPQLSWWDVVVVGSLASIGFTVALLINDVTFRDSPDQLSNGQLAIVFTNLVAIVVSAVVVIVRLRVVKRSISPFE